MPRASSTTTLRSALGEYLATEAAGGACLLAGAVAAVVWANTRWAHIHDELLGHRIGPLDVRSWVTDGLMTLFFFVVGLEISREVRTGELRRPRAAALPVLAALGGMVVPALIYLAWNPSAPGARGWAVPMATDIAFAVGVLALLGPRVPPPVKLFLLALAIVDDLGAILVIAVAYASRVDLAWLAAAGVAVGGVWAAKGRPLALVSLGPLAWWCTHESGVHATIAGVALAFAIPPARGETYERRVHPVATFLVVPLFALANAGVAVDAHVFAGDAGRVAAGTGVGLVVGKLVGISGASWIAVRCGVANLPAGMGVRHVVGAALLGGIGFTVSLVVTHLAFGADAQLLAGAKAAILGASVLAAVLGTVVLLASGRRVSA
jgi:NhaA family Na+:H+ antiporter